jgi:hypothetical protein
MWFIFIFPVVVLFYAVALPCYGVNSMCRCWRVHDNVLEHVSHWWDEVVELFEALLNFMFHPGNETIIKVFDEASDVCVTLGRIQTWFIVKCFGITDIVYFRFPGDGLYLQKIGGRMHAYACIRSPRHLIDGHCRSL